MNRTCVLSLVAALAVCCLADAVQAQRGGFCPFMMQQQFHIQQQWQRQQAQMQMQWQREQAMMMRQQQHQQMMWQRQQHAQQRQQHARLSTHTRGITQTRSVASRHTTTHTHLSTRYIPVRLHVPTGPGHGRYHVPYYVREITTVHRTTHTTTHLRNITTQRLHTERRLNLTTQVRRTSTTTQGRAQRTTTEQRATRSSERGSATRREVQHTPRTQVRVNISMTCGNCHGCQQARPQLPTQAPQRDGPPALPVVKAPRPPVPTPVFLPGRPRPGFPLDVPLVARPRPVMPLPVTRPPALPTLVDVPRRPLDFPIGPGPGPTVRRPTLPVDWMVKRPTPEDESDSYPSPGSLPQKPGLPVTSLEAPPTLPPLKPLQRPGLLSPGLITTADAGSKPLSGPAVPYEPLLPNDVVQAPELPALPLRTPLQLTLQPGLDPTDAPTLETVDVRPLALEVVLRPPTLPPLPEAEVP